MANSRRVTELKNAVSKRPSGMPGLSSSRQQRGTAARGSHFLDVTFELMREDGFEAIQLGAVANVIGGARVAIDNHLANCEEILVANAAGAVHRRLRLIESTVALKATVREEVLSVCLASMVFVDLLPIEQAIRNQFIWPKPPDARRDVVRENDQACIALVAGVIGLGIESRAPPPPRGLTIAETLERVTFGLSSLCYGGLTIEASGLSLPAGGIRDARPTALFQPQ